MDQIPVAVIVSRDGQRAIAPMEYQGRGQMPKGIGHAYFVLTDPAADRTRLIVNLDSIFSFQLNVMAREGQAADDVIHEIAYVAIGEHWM
jgi:hypothetical protein